MLHSEALYSPWSSKSTANSRSGDALKIQWILTLSGPNFLLLLDDQKERMRKWLRASSPQATIEGCNSLRTVGSRRSQFQLSISHEAHWVIFGQLSYSSNLRKRVAVGPKLVKTRIFTGTGTEIWNLPAIGGYVLIGSPLDIRSHWWKLRMQAVIGQCNQPT